MSEQLQFQTIDELRALSLAELQALWELVPTDRQRAYKQAYEREVRSAGASGSDELERQVTAELTRRYQEAALVPVGARWARTPTRVQEAARHNELLDAPEDAVQTPSSKRSPKVMAALGMMALLVLGFTIARFLSARSPKAFETRPTITPTVTPAVSPTPTPLALEAQDEVIQGGDPARVVAYPVNLQVVTDDGAAPRVWVVQRRAIRASEWNFDPDPDTASFVNGMSVRPVIGISWSEDNQAFFDRLGEGTVFNLTMNTGAILRYQFVSRGEVRRSDTSIFRQVSPGLVLLLIGKTDDQGLPTALRTLVTATYPPEQELSRDGQQLGTNTAFREGEVGQTLTLGTASITLKQAQGLPDPSNLPPGEQSLHLDFDVTAGSAVLDTTGWQMELIDDGGQVYAPDTSAVGDVGDGVLPSEVSPQTATSASVSYVVPENMRSAHWLVTEANGEGVSFHLTLDAPSSAATFAGVDVQVVSVTYTEGQMTARLWIYNGQAETRHFSSDDLWLALGYAPDPPGPRSPSEGLSAFDLLPGQAVDLRLVWAWSGEPYASLGVGEDRFAIRLSGGS